MRAALVLALVLGGCTSDGDSDGAGGAGGPGSGQGDGGPRAGQSGDGGGAGTDPGGVAGTGGTAGGGGAPGTAGTPGADGGVTDAGAPVPDAAPVSFADFCSRSADRRYSDLQRCYGQEAYPEARRADGVERRVEACQTTTAALRAGRMLFDGAQAAACLAGSRVSLCTGRLVDDCLASFAPGLALGSPCYEDEGWSFGLGDVSGGCEGGICAGATCPQTCVALPAVGAPCVGRGQCGPGRYCDEQSTCRELLSVGDICEDQGCPPDSQCLQTSQGKRCVRYREEGDDCDAENPCRGPLVCNAGTCALKAVAGGACFIANNCPEDLRCIDPAGQGTRTCQAPGQAEAPCQFDRDCAPDHICRDDACAALPMAEQPCDEGKCATDLWCQYDGFDDPGTCRARRARGQPCFSNGFADPRACLDGLFCTAGGTCEPQSDLDGPCAVFIRESCADGLFCSRQLGTCQPPRAQGQACNPVWENTCAAGLGCHCGRDADMCGSTAPEPEPTDTCQPLRPLGEACKRRSECESGSCQAAGDDPVERCQSNEPPPACIGPG